MPREVSDRCNVLHQKRARAANEPPAHAGHGAPSLETQTRAGGFTNLPPRAPLPEERVLSSVMVQHGVTCCSGARLLFGRSLLVAAQGTKPYKHPWAHPSFQV